jgi:hypothetical protein
MKRFASRWSRFPPSICTAKVAATLCALLVACAHAPTDGSRTSAVSTRTPWAASTSTFQWNEYATDLIARNAVGQFPAVRTLAYMNLAINNAIVQARALGLEPDGAAAGAAAGMLSHFFPKDEQATMARLQREVGALGAEARTRFLSGVEVGRQAAAQAVALAQADRATAAWSGTVPAGDDKWSSRQQPPNHPSYPSNHACISGAIGHVLDAILPNTNGMYEAMGRQAGESRVYGGIHYQMDLDAGFDIARKVAARALEVGVPKDKPFMPLGR